MTRSKLAAILSSAIAATSTLAIATGAAHAGGNDWDKDWTALTVASNGGAWGSATHAVRMTAMMQAMAQCRVRAGTSSGGCGSHTATVRGGWMVAYACGEETFIVTGATFPATHAAAINQEIELRQFERIEIGDCRRLVAIGPDGSPSPAHMLNARVPLLPEGPANSHSANRH